MARGNLYLVSCTFLVNPRPSVKTSWWSQFLPFNSFLFKCHPSISSWGSFRFRIPRACSSPPSTEDEQPQWGTHLSQTRNHLLHLVYVLRNLLIYNQTMTPLVLFLTNYPNFLWAVKGCIVRPQAKMRSRNLPTIPSPLINRMPWSPLVPFLT